MQDYRTLRARLTDKPVPTMVTVEGDYVATGGDTRGHLLGGRLELAGDLTVQQNSNYAFTPESAHTVHVELNGLPPAREFYYRFKAERYVSPTGRTRTAPAPWASGGTLAATSHVAKATTRAAANTSPEPFSNLGLSLLEDGLVVAAVWLAVLACLGIAYAAVYMLRLYQTTMNGPARGDGSGDPLLGHLGRHGAFHALEVQLAREPQDPRRAPAANRVVRSETPAAGRRLLLHAGCGRSEPGGRG